LGLSIGVVLGSSPMSRARCFLFYIFLYLLTSLES
jgi:hypothetical protein